MTGQVRRHTDKFLLTYSAEHVAYEFEMFLGIAELLSVRSSLLAADQRSAACLQNLLLEGFVLHLRNIVDFFFPGRTRPDDVVAADFCAEGVWQPELPRKLQEARRRANKELAHLTSKRKPGVDASKGWDLVGLSEEVHALMRLFVEQALPSRLAPVVARVVAEGRPRARGVSLSC